MECLPQLYRYATLLLTLVIKIQSVIDKTKKHRVARIGESQRLSLFRLQNYILADHYVFQPQFAEKWIDLNPYLCPWV